MEEKKSESILWKFLQTRQLYILKTLWPVIEDSKKISIKDFVKKYKNPKNIDKELFSKEDLENFHTFAAFGEDCQGIDNLVRKSPIWKRFSDRFTFIIDSPEMVPLNRFLKEFENCGLNGEELTEIFKVLQKFDKKFEEILL